jgi:glutamine synthetase
MRAASGPLVSDPERDDSGSHWRVTASAEADAATALAVSLAAIGAATGGATGAAIGAATDGAQASGQGVDDLSRSASILECPWLCDWLGKPILENSVALFEHEARLFADSVTDWEVERYWGVA